MFLVLIETSGNQNYIFSTNKLKDNIGASELTYRVGTQWVLEAVGQVTGSQKLQEWQNSSELREKLLDKKLNPPIESAGTEVEIIIAASGKALLLTQRKENARRIIQFVTHKALIEAPGLEVSGVYCKFDWEKCSLGETNEQVHQKYEQVRSSRPSSDLRFLRLPVVDQCATSGLPAYKLDNSPKPKPISLLTSKKRENSEKGLNRLIAIPKSRNLDLRLPASTNEMERKIEEGVSWFAVIHADGNGLGKIFLRFHEHLKDEGITNTGDKNRLYVDTLRKFSFALDICTENAFIKALSLIKTNPDFIIPLVPLILGGDDLTVVCDGQYALRFTHAFLEAFEQETQKNHPGVESVIADVASKALKVGRLSACAGIAIIKPHFPFSVAYQLAESLMRVAKEVKKQVKHPTEDTFYPCSALDFHILYDSSDVDLKDIRSKLQLEKNIEKTYLYNRPFVTTSLENLKEATGQEWVEFHHWQKLQDRVHVLLEENDDGRRHLPNSQIHELRTSLFLGRNAADARYSLIRERYRDKGIKQLEGDTYSLFAQEPNTNIYMTALIDAIDATEFLKEKKHEQEEQQKAPA